jgi:hypothetical protein
VGTITPSGKLHIEDTAGGVITVVRNVTVTANAFQNSIFKAITSGDMADGFGHTNSFSIQDNAGVNNEIATFGAVRSGADNKGSLIFTTNNGTGVTEKMRVNNLGNVGIGTTTPVQLLHLHKTSGSNIREVLLRGTVSDSGNDAFVVGNGTSLNGTFAPSFNGYQGSVNNKFCFYNGCIKFLCCRCS